MDYRRNRGTGEVGYETANNSAISRLISGSRGVPKSSRKEYKLTRATGARSTSGLRFPSATAQRRRQNQHEFASLIGANRSSIRLPYTAGGPPQEFRAAKLPSRDGCSKSSNGDRFASNGNLLYSTRTRIGKPGESQGRKVTGLREESYGRQTAEGSCERWDPAIAMSWLPYDVLFHQTPARPSGRRSSDAVPPYSAALSGW